MRCSLYNLLGQEVRVLFEQEVRPLGEIDVVRDLSDVAVGSYVVLVRSGSSAVSAPLVISR